METFVVRVWTPTTPEPALTNVGLHGIVEHPSSGRSTPFRQFSELVVFIDAHLSAAWTPLDEADEVAHRQPPSGQQE